MTLLPINGTGDSGTGDATPLSGVFRNLAIVPSGYDSAELRYTFEAAVLSMYEVGVYIDGALSQRLPSDSTQAAFANLAEGRHTLGLASTRVGDIWPERHGDSQGSRAWLRWTRSDDTTCAGYQILIDDGSTGTPDTLIGTLTTVTIDQRINAKAENDNPGRVTFYGTYAGTGTVNDAITLLILNDSTYSYTTAAGLSGSGEWTQGQSLALPYGALAKILDDAADYGASSTYTILVGPTNEFLTEELTPGTYTFEVRAFDHATNVNEEDVYRRKVRIPTVPESVTDLVAEYGASDITFTWQDPESLDGIRIYTNYEPNLKRFLDYVIEDVPLASVAAGWETWTFTPDASAEGVLRFYMRPYLDNVERRDLTLYTFNWPASPADVGLVLSTPTNVQATAIADGGIRVEFDYRFRELDHLDELQVSISGTSGIMVLVGSAIDPDTGQGYPVAHYSVDFEGPYTGTKYVRVLAESADDEATTVSDEVTVLPDATPPDFAGPLRGVPQ